MVREMQIHNYSEKSIESYSAPMSKIQNFFQVPIDKISVEQFKNFLQLVLTKGEVSQMISLCRNIKHKTLLALAYSSGLRLNEIRT